MNFRRPLSVLLTTMSNNGSSNKQECIKTYISAWNAADAGQRTTLLSQCFAEHGTYVDPHVPSPLSSRTAMDEMIATFRSRLNHELKLLQEPDLHNDVFSFSVEIGKRRWNPVSRHVCRDNRAVVQPNWTSDWVFG